MEFSFLNISFSSENKMERRAEKPEFLSVDTKIFIGGIGTCFLVLGIHTNCSGHIHKFRFKS